MGNFYTWTGKKHWLLAGQLASNCKRLFTSSCHSDWMIRQVRQTCCPTKWSWLANQAFLPRQVAGERAEASRRSALAALARRHMISQRSVPFGIPGWYLWTQRGPEPSTFLPLFCLALQPSKFSCWTVKTLGGIFSWTFHDFWIKEPSA